MRVAVLGAGVIGVTSAWYLAKAGHEVVLVDRNGGPALETSFANAGEVCPSFATPWAAPGIPIKAMKWLFMRHAPLIIRAGRVDMAMLRWMAAMVSNCTAARYEINRDRMMRLAAYSREKLIALRDETGIQYEARQRGTLQLCETQGELDAIATDIPVLRSHGLRCEILDRAGCLAIEPGLRLADASFVGGVHMPDDETGDCFQFTTALADLAVGRGVSFIGDTCVSALHSERGRIVGVETDRRPIVADAYVLTTGSFTPALVRSLDLNIPIYPVKGYSITAEIVDDSRAPVSTVLDGGLKVALTRLGNRIRVGGLAELAGFVHDLPARRRETLDLALDRLFPGAGDIAGATFWTGLRPMTPDSTPVVGGTHIPNLYINAGHGTMGWTMACGSGQVIADAVTGRPSDILTADLAVSRYR